MNVNLESWIMVAAIILALIAVLMTLGSEFRTAAYRRNTNQELGELRLKVTRLEGQLQHYETQNAILTRENHDLLQRLVDNKK